MSTARSKLEHARSKVEGVMLFATAEFVASMPCKPAHQGCACRSCELGKSHLADCTRWVTHSAFRDNK